MATTNHDEVVSLSRSIKAHFGGNPRGHRIAIWGFNENEQSHNELIDLLLDMGACVSVHSTTVYDEGVKAFGCELSFSSGRWGAVRGADALVILSSDETYSRTDVGLIRWNLREPVIFDTQNCVVGKLDGGSIVRYTADRGDLIAA